MLPFWKKNLFSIPSGALGKQLLEEMTRLINCWCLHGPSRQYSIKALMILPSLLLQKSSKTSKSKENKEHLKRRLELWKQKRISELVDEVKAVQCRLAASNSKRHDVDIKHRFSKLMELGKIKQAMKLLSSNSCKGMLELSDETLSQLIVKHPESEPLHEDFLLHGPIKNVNPIIYDEIDESLVFKAANKTDGAAGPSKLDGDEWKKILCSNSFGAASIDLRKAIARMTRELCSQDINDHESIEALLAWTLIPLDKNPGVRPIGIGEVLRRIIGKVVIYTMKKDVTESAGSLQLCAGQDSGCESAIHGMVDIWNDINTEGVLQVDASNAFNSINRNVLLHNIKIICPEMACYVTNTYCQPARLFIIGGKELSSKEGTTQGDPISMAVYALGLGPLLTQLILDQELASNEDNVKLAAYADDLAAGGGLKDLKIWWDTLIKIGPKIGYYPNADKSWLIVKPSKLQDAETIFESSGVHITASGNRHLGAIIGSIDFRHQYMSSLVQKWVAEINTLSDFARTDPHSAYSAFVHGMKHKFNYVMRTIPNIKEDLIPLEDVIRNTFIKTIFNGYECDDTYRTLLSLPPKYGGLGITNVTEICDIEYQNSRTISAENVKLIMEQNQVYSADLQKLNSIKDQIKKGKQREHERKLKTIKEKLDGASLRLLNCVSEPSTSNWLTALPLKDHGFHLDKRSFWDALFIRYNLPLDKLPSNCVCGSTFHLDHALTCKRGGFIAVRHNDIRDLTAKLLTQVCHDVKLEPALQPLTGEIFAQKSATTDDEARVDISARGFWVRGQVAFFYVRAFSPLAKVHVNRDLKSIYSSQEKEKKRRYNHRIIQIEMATFTPLVFSCMGGMSRETQRFYSQLAEKLADKHKTMKSEMMCYLKTKLNFSLIRSLTLCLRGTRQQHPTTELKVDDVKYANSVTSIHH